MTTLDANDLRRLTEAVRELYAVDDLDGFPQRVMHVASAVASSDLTSYTEVDPLRGEARGTLDSAEANGVLAERLPYFERHMHQHPLVRHFSSVGHDGVAKISDFLSRREWKRLELYREFYRYFGVLHQMIAEVTTPGSVITAIACNRKRRDFDERDRLALNLLRPHLAQAFENAGRVAELRLEVVRRDAALEALDQAIVRVDGDGRALGASDSAERLLRGLGSPPGVRALTLPDEVRAWVREVADTLRQTGDRLATPRWLTLRAGAREVRLRLLPDPRPDQFVLVACSAEDAARSETLEALGLTPKQAEVLSLVARGLTNREAAQRMGASARTVQNHLAAVFDRLGVRTRSAAAAIATRQQERRAGWPSRAGRSH